MKKISILLCLALMFVFSNANAVSSVSEKSGLIEFNKAQPIMIIDYLVPCAYAWQMPPKCVG